MVTIPPVAEEVSANASLEAATGLETCTCELVSVVVVEITSDTTAATPLSMATLLSPHRRHVAEPVLVLQDRFLL